MSTIQQGARDFSSYYAEFQRYATEVQWDEAARLAALKRGLSYRLKNDLVTVLTDLATIAEFVALYVTVWICTVALFRVNQARQLPGAQQ